MAAVDSDYQFISIDAGVLRGDGEEALSSSSSRPTKTNWPRKKHITLAC